MREGDWLRVRGVGVAARRSFVPRDGVARRWSGRGLVATRRWFVLVVGSARRWFVLVVGTARGTVRRWLTGRAVRLGDALPVRGWLRGCAVRLGVRAGSLRATSRRG